MGIAMRIEPYEQYTQDMQVWVQRSVTNSWADKALQDYRVRVRVKAKCLCQGNPRQLRL